MEIIWEPILGWEGLYEISNLGIVRSLIRPNYKRWQPGFLRPTLDKDCYLKIVLEAQGKSECFRVNRLVAIAFIPNPDKLPIVDHINGVRWDNRVDNLRWFTQSENVKESFRKGRKPANIKAVLMCDNDGNILKRYESIASTEKDGFKSRNVNQVVKGQRPSHHGYKWIYEYQQ